MFLQIRERRVDSHLLKGKAVGMEPEIARQRDIERVLPTAFGDLQQPVYGGLFALQTLLQQGLSPPCCDQLRVADQLLGATYTADCTVHL